MNMIENQQQFIDLFHVHYKFLCMIAMHYVKDQNIAEDIVQDFFIDFYEQRREIDIENHFKGYASRAVKYLSISWIRTNQIQINRLSELQRSNSFDINPDCEEIDKVTLHFEVLRLLEELPPKRKQILLMSSREGLSNKQIAEKLGISIHTVKSQIVKSYAFIRKNIDLATHIDNDDHNRSRISNYRILFILLSGI